jgi:hypothetical protein
MSMLHNLLVLPGHKSHRDKNNYVPIYVPAGFLAEGSHEKPREMAAFRWISGRASRTGQNL